MNFIITEINNPNNRIHSVIKIEEDIDSIGLIHQNEDDKMISIGYKKGGNELKGFYYDLEGPSFKLNEIKEEGEYDLKIEYKGFGDDKILEKNLNLKIENFNITSDIILKPALKKKEVKENALFNLGELVNFKGAVFDIKYKGRNEKENKVIQLLEESNNYWNLDLSPYTDWDLVDFDILDEYAVIVFENKKQISNEVEIILSETSLKPKILFKENL